MSDSSDQPWSNNPDAPQISYFVYTQEKGYFAGSVIAVVLYGVVVALFFQCMNALLYPINPAAKGVRWGLVAQTVAMFSFLTIGAAINRDGFAVSYINGREFTGVDGSGFPGPIGYQSIAFSGREAISYVAFFMFPFNQWLADGLLLHRCFVIYSKNYWAIAFPSLMYLASIVTGVLWCYCRVGREEFTSVFQIPYFSICLSLNVLLTLLISARLLLHSRNIRAAIGESSEPVSLYTTVVTMLVESCALYAVGYLLYIVPTVSLSYVGSIFSSALGEIQVIAPFLIILRVANRTALTSGAVTSGNVGSIHFRSGGGSTDDGPMGSSGETSDRFGVGSQES